MNNLVAHPRDHSPLGPIRLDAAYRRILDPFLILYAPSEDRHVVNIERGADGWPEAGNLSQINGAAEDILMCQACILHLEQAERAAFLNLRSDVNVTVRPIFTPRDGPEHGNMANATLSKRGFFCRKALLYRLKRRQRQNPQPSIALRAQGSLNPISQPINR